MSALDQGLAAWIAQQNQERQIPLHEALDALQQHLEGQERAFAGALHELDWVRDKLGAPILGSDRTKHGEIAEFAEVGLRRARDVLAGHTPGAIWDETARFAPEDYTIGGLPVQSKFINGANNGLQHVLNHAERYRNFGKADGGYYHIPRDQYETIQHVLKGETDGLNAQSVAAIKEKVQRLEEMRGRPFVDLVRPASHDYADVQQGQIDQTLEQHESELRADNREIKQGIKEEHREKIEAARVKAAPSLGEMGKAAAVGAAVGAGLQLTVAIYQKWSRDGKPPTRFNAEDWKEVARPALSGAVTGGVSAAALYGLTNYAALSAPFAGAVVSSGRAMVALVKQYRTGQISFDQFTDLSIVASTEAGIAAAGAALGQALIPIPILGAFIGSAVAGLVSSHAKRLLGEQGDAVARRLEAEFREQVDRLSEEHRLLLAKLDAEMLRLGDLTAAAFDLTINARLLLLNSTRLAEAHGVPDEEIIRTVDDVDRFILGAASAHKNRPA